MRRLGSFLFCVSLTAVAAIAAGQSTVATQISGDDVYSAGVSIQVPGPVAGDAVLAGGTILVTGHVSQDVLAAGGSVTVTGVVDDDVRLAGGSVTVTNDVAGDAILAGGTVTLAEGGTVGGNVWSAGGVVTLSAAVKGDVRAAGGEVILGGQIDGNAEVYAESIEVKPGTVIVGTLRYHGPRPAAIPDDAEVGEFVYIEDKGLRHRGVPFIGMAFAALLFFLSLAVCALLFMWLLPNVSGEAAANARNRMLVSLGTGLLAVIVIPMVGTALFVLVATMPVAVTLFAIYVVLLVAGALTAVVCMGGWLRDRFLSDRGNGIGVIIISVLAGAAAYWVVALVPFIGALVVMLAFVTGTGGLVLLLARLYRQPLHLPADSSK